jgi:hypothetical protein
VQVPDPGAPDQRRQQRTEEDDRSIRVDRADTLSARKDCQSAQPDDRLEAKAYRADR